MPVVSTKTEYMETMAEGIVAALQQRYPEMGPITKMDEILELELDETLKTLGIGNHCRQYCKRCIIQMYHTVIYSRLSNLVTPIFVIFFLKYEKS